MSGDIICTAQVNPYLNNPSARETARSQEIIEGKLYAKLSYKLTIPGNISRIIQVIALVIFTGFLALAFRKTIERLWSEGFKRDQNVSVKIPLGFFNETPGMKDIEKLIVPYLDNKDLVALYRTARGNQDISKTPMIDQINSGTITPGDLGLKTIDKIIAFFGPRCKAITKLNVKQGFYDSDIRKIAESFPNLEHFSIGQSHISNESDLYLAQLIHLKSFALGLNLGNDDYSYVQQWPDLTSLDLSTNLVQDLSFLQYCPQLKTLNLDGCWLIKNLNDLRLCTQLEHLNLSRCEGISDFSPLQDCPSLQTLNLGSRRVGATLLANLRDKGIQVIQDPSLQ